MNYRHLALRCDCGDVPERIAEVGFTEDHQLAVHWWCERCQRVVYLTKPLTECWRECPSPDRSLDRVLNDWSKSQEDTPVQVKTRVDAEDAEDARFLRSIGVQV